MGQRSRLLVAQVAVPYVRRHFRRLLRALEGVPSAKDPESVHQTRVACRRLRAALSVFRDLIGPKKADRWRKAVRDLAVVFGPARDLDVEIASTLSQMLRIEDQTVLHGLAFWLSHLEEQRFQMQRQLIRAVRVFRKQPLVKQINRWIKANDRGRMSSDLTQLHSKISLTKVQQELLSGRLAELLQASESLADPTDVEGHHFMRIAAKKLRYSIEALAPALGVIHEVALEALRNLQSLLGEIHDYDVWISRIDQVLASLSGNSFDGPSWLNPVRFTPGLVYLRDQYRELREIRFRQLVDLWHDEKVRGIWKALQNPGIAPEADVPSVNENTIDRTDVASKMNGKCL
jgi:CHAD domain-containing protein